VLLWKRLRRYRRRSDWVEIDPPVSITAGSPSEGTALLKRLRSRPATALHINGAHSGDFMCNGGLHKKTLVSLARTATGVDKCGGISWNACITESTHILLDVSPEHIEGKWPWAGIFR
jgi:hypothetical protein